MEKQKWFLIKENWKDWLGNMSDEDAGKFFKALYSGEIPDGMVGVLYSSHVDEFNRINEEREKTLDKFREAGAKGAAKRWHKDANGGLIGGYTPANGVEWHTHTHTYTPTLTPTYTNTDVKEDNVCLNVHSDKSPISWDGKTLPTSQHMFNKYSVEDKMNITELVVRTPFNKLNDFQKSFVRDIKNTLVKK
jgi:hypothetical protein